MRVTGSTITGARSTGVHLYGDAALLDHNTITQSGTAAITVHGGYARILANTLTRNRFEQPDGVPGGQLNLEPSSRFATVSGNTLDGAGYQIGGGPIALVDPLTGAAHTCPAVVDAGGAFPLGVDGVEGYGADHVLDGNTVVNHANTGLLIKGAARWRLNGNNVANNGAGVVFLPLWGQPNVDVALTQMTITGSARQGLSLQAMTATGAAPAGCSTTTVVGGAPRIERIGEVAAAYDGCQ